MIQFNYAGNCYMWEAGVTHKALTAFKFSVFTDSSTSGCLRFIFKRLKLLREILTASYTHRKF